MPVVLLPREPALSHDLRAPGATRFGALRHVFTLAVLAACLGFGATAHAQDDWLGRDKFLHFGVSATLSAAGYGLASVWLERPALRCVAGASFALSAGVAKEVWDATGHGDPSWRDLTWDLVGTAVGVTLAWGVDLALMRIRRPSRPLSFQGRGLVVRF